MNDAIPPTPRSPWRNRAISAPMSKSATWTRTVIARRPSAAGHRREDRDFVAIRNRLRSLDEPMVDGEAGGTVRRELVRPCAAAVAQPAEDGVDGRRAVVEYQRFAGVAERLAKPREI